LAFGPGGTNLWSFGTSGILAEPPATDANGTIYLASTDGSFYVLAPDGILKWKAPLAQGTSGGPSLGNDGTIYVGSSARALYAFDQSGNLKWQWTAASAVIGTVSVGLDGTLFFGTQNTNYGRWDLPQVFPLYAILPTGVKRWETMIGSLAAGIACADNGTICFADAGSLTSLNADGTGRWTFVSTTNGVGTPTIGQNGRVYFSAGPMLYALQADIGAAPTSWPSFRGDAQLTGRAQAGGNRPQLRTAGVNPQGVFGFNLSGPAGSTLQIEVSTDLVRWNTFSTVAINISGDAAYFPDPAGSMAQRRFYRAVVVR
jgi:outer membrane protein assembly factor BamB